MLQKALELQILDIPERLGTSSPSIQRDEFVLNLRI